MKLEDDHGDCSVSLAAVLVVITKTMCCQQLRVITMIVIICYCWFFFVFFFPVSGTVTVPVVKLTNYDIILFPAIFFI